MCIASFVFLLVLVYILHLNCINHILVLQKDLVVYEMNVRAFTADDSSGLDSKIRGSYLGVIEKVVFACSRSLNALHAQLFFTSIADCKLLKIEVVWHFHLTLIQSV